MTTEQKLKFRALYIVIVRIVKLPVKAPQRILRNLLEAVGRLFPQFKPSGAQWQALCDKLMQLIQSGDADGTAHLLEQALLGDGGERPLLGPGPGDGGEASGSDADGARG